VKQFLLFGILALATACQSISQTPLTEAGPTVALQARPAPVTGTAPFTAVPVPTLTSTPMPRYFTEDFNSLDTAAWTSYQTGGEGPPSLRIENGLLRLDLPSPNTWFYALPAAHTYDNVAVSASFSSAYAGAVGLICRQSNSGWYEFNLASDGTYNVLFGRLLTEGVAAYAPIAADASKYLQAGNLEYEIGLTCQDDVLFLYINGKLFRKLDVSRFGLTRGQVGLSAASFQDAPTIVSIDWFKVGEPE